MLSPKWTKSNFTASVRGRLRSDLLATLASRPTNTCRKAAQRMLEHRSRISALTPTAENEKLGQRCL
ncbi:MAG: hypothetical protein CMM00_01965 [Rhodopirellula sp.]|nr:hypothetical protein [Rhodopirellula sp.]